MGTQTRPKVDPNNLKKIKRLQKKALGEIHKEMDRLGMRLDEISEKAESGASLTDSEKQEREKLFDAIHDLGEVEARQEIFKLSALDSSAKIENLLEQVKQANDELKTTKENVESISATIKQAGDFLKILAGILTQLTGLLAELA